MEIDKVRKQLSVTNEAVTGYARRFLGDNTPNEQDLINEALSQVSGRITEPDTDFPFDDRALARTYVLATIKKVITDLISSPKNDSTTVVDFSTKRAFPSISNADSESSPEAVLLDNTTGDDNVQQGNLFDEVKRSTSEKDRVVDSTSVSPLIPLAEDLQTTATEETIRIAEDLLPGLRPDSTKDPLYPVLYTTLIDLIAVARGGSSEALTSLHSRSEAIRDFLDYMSSQLQPHDDVVRFFPARANRRPRQSGAYSSPRKNSLRAM